MKKITKFMPYIIMILLAIVICAPIFTMNLYLNNEAILHMSRIVSIDEVIKSGVFPPIIDYKFMNGFGYALNLFYGPLTTYIPIILLNIFGTSGFALKIFTFFTVIASAITMYNFTFNITKRKSISLISSIIYISMPYKLSDIYSRNAVGEYTAFIFIPMVFEALYNLIHNNTKRNFLLCIGIIGLVLSHTITTLYIALFSIIYLILNINKLKNIEIWKKIIANIIIAFLVCNFYVVPLLEHNFETNYTLFSNDLMGTNGKSVDSSALELKDLFESELGNQEIRFSIGIVVCILAFFTVFCARKVERNYKKIYIDFTILSVITLIMTTKIFPWKMMPSLLTVIQFAWRNLGFFAFFVSFICAINANIVAEKILKKEIWKDTFIFSIICSVFVFSFLGVIKYWRFDDILQEKNLDIDIKSKERIFILKINREYLPLKSIKNLKYINERENRSYILEGEASIISEEKNKLQDTIVLEDIQDNTLLELPYLYYLGYTANINYDGNSYKLKITESDKGFLQVKLPKTENATITIKYEGTTLEKLSYIVSLLGVIFLIIYIKKDKKIYEVNKE